MTMHTFHRSLVAILLLTLTCIGASSSSSSSSSSTAGLRRVLNELAPLITNSYQTTSVTMYDAFRDNCTKEVIGLSSYISCASTFCPENEQCGYVTLDVNFLGPYLDLSNQTGCAAYTADDSDQDSTTTQAQDFCYTVQYKPREVLEDTGGRLGPGGALDTCTTSTTDQDGTETACDSCVPCQISDDDYGLFIRCENVPGGGPQGECRRVENILGISSARSARSFANSMWLSLVIAATHWVISS